jgi:hypothetical protein
MGLDFSTLVYLPNFNMFARPIVFTPVASQPGAPAYTGRGIYHSDQISYAADDNSIISDQQTTLDILEVEFDVMPVQNDVLTIPPDGEVVTGIGDYLISDVRNNGGGETTLQLRRLEGGIPLRV